VEELSCIHDATAIPTAAEDTVGAVTILQLMMQLTGMTDRHSS